ncbi:MAG: hypothetical protein QXE64_01110 [Candidatus Pacearchaeota archaeon]
MSLENLIGEKIKLKDYRQTLVDVINEYQFLISNFEEKREYIDKIVSFLNSENPTVYLGGIVLLEYLLGENLEKIIKETDARFDEKLS